MKKLIVICSLLAAGCSKSSDGTNDSRGACERGVADCSADATCADVETSPGFTCTCNAGFAGDGVTCTDVDECAAGAEVAFETSAESPAEDCITDGVCLARGAVGPLYNSVVDEPFTTYIPWSLYYTRKPTGTLWASSACSDVSPGEFAPFTRVGGGGSAVGNPACLWLTAENRFFDVLFSSWGGSDSAAFAYTRAEYNACGAGATCTNTTGSYTCECPSGSTFDGTTCVDDDECASADTNDCGANATCTNTPGSHACTCNPGFTGDGIDCTDVDECSGYDFSNPEEGTEQDWIAPSVRIARDPYGPLYNSLLDDTGKQGGDVPTGTLWTAGTCDSVASEEDFAPFLSSSFFPGSGYMTDIVDAPGCLEVVDEGQYHDITFTTWASYGVFAYTRTAYCPVPGTACQNTEGSYSCVPIE